MVAKLSSLFNNEKNRILAIFLVSILSIWQLYYYFFSWEEFSYFYAYQNPEEADMVFGSHGFANHPVLPYLGFVFRLFGYQPEPYNIVNIFIFFLLSLVVYFFAATVGELPKKQAFFAGLIFAAGYYGIGTFSTDTYSGINGGVGLILTVISIILFRNLVLKKTLLNLQLFVLIYLLAILLFPARSYFLPGVLSLYFLYKSKSFVKSFIVGLVLLVPLVVLLSRQLGIYQSSIPFVDFRFKDFINSLLGNIGNTFFPSIIIKNGILSIILGAAISFISLINSKTRIIFLFLLISLVGQLLAIVVNQQYFSIWLSDNHFFSSFTIFSAVIIATLLRKFPGLLVAIVIFTVILSNIQLKNTLNEFSDQLRYFYETVQKYVPDDERKKAVVVFTKEPRPLTPFAHLPEISPEIYLAGFYGKNSEELKVYQSLEEAQTYLKKYNLPPDSLYLFLYASKDLQDYSLQARDILSKSENYLVQNPSTAEVSGIVPFEVLLTINPEPASDQTKDKIRDYLSWADAITTKTSPQKSFEDRKIEYLTDHDYGTTWIPANWENPVSITFTFPEIKKIDYLVWAVSRTATWPQRNPTSYVISVTQNNSDWLKVKEVTDGQILSSNQVNKEFLNFELPVNGLKFEIYKTSEGALPAIDDFEFITSDISEIPYDQISESIIKNQDQICLQWKTTDDDNYRSNRQQCLKRKVTQKQFNFKIEARSKSVTGFRLLNNNNQELEIKNLQISYPKI